MSRIHGTPTTLDYEKVRAFFTRRSSRIQELGLLKVTMYQDEELARRRDAHEKETLLPTLGVTRDTRVMDIGCGVGRWADLLAPQVAAYLGTDFCEAYVSAAQERLDSAGLPRTTHRCQYLAAEDISVTALSITPPFDLVIVAGLLTFLNDDDVLTLLRKLPDLTERQGTIYIREPVGLEGRLTLREHYSEELGEYYHAVYRSVQEYEALFRQTLNTFQFLRDQPLYPADLCNRKETAQHVFLLKLQP